MRRRSFLKTVTAGTLLGSVGASGTALAAETINPLMFDSTASLLNEAGGPLTSGDAVAVWASPAATNADEDGNNDAVIYPDSADIPLVASAGGVVGFGAPVAQDDTDFAYGNEEFVLNVLDAEADGTAVAFDEGHGQYYDTGEHDQFIKYAEDNGYEVAATGDLAAALPDADAAIVTSPAYSFSDAELAALSTFVGNGGALLLFDQSDYSGYDSTANLNAIASAVDAPFRFNDDQVYDNERNTGASYVPSTDRFASSFDYFTQRSGIAPPELEKGQRYEVDVQWVTDGDTVDISFPNGYEDTVRVLGLDTPETGSTEERLEEWEGLSDESYLKDRGDVATDFAIERLAGETVALRFDEDQPLRGGFGRLLGYIEYDADGDGEYDTQYNRAAVREGHARVYDSGFAGHDDFLREELAARAAGRGLWTESDPDSSETVRNGEVTSLYAPYATAVRTTGGRLDGKRVPVSAEPTATQQDATVDYEADVPLVGIDQHAGVAMTGSSLIDEGFEAAEGFPEDTSGYGNYAFLTSLLDRLSDRAGDVLVDGGHGQFEADRAISAEDAAYYQRYLEGVDIGFEQVNDLTGGLLERGRALLLSAPSEPLTDAELDALRAFVEDGGAVVLLGGDVPAAARENLDAVAAALSTDLRLGRGRVLDETANLDSRASLPTTSNFDDWFRLFGGYDPETNYKGGRGGPGVPGSQGNGKGHSKGNGKGHDKGKGKGHAD